MGMFKKLGLGLATLVAVVAFAQSPVKLVNGSSTELGIAPAGARATIYLQAITTSGTTITTSNTYVQMLFCSNTSGTDRTVDITDTQGSPVVFANDLNVPANSLFMVVANATGLYMQGLKITSSANSAIVCQLQGVQ